MTTHVVSDRFTAAEALDFVNYIADKSSLDDLKVPIKARTTGPYVRDISAYWRQLPPDFVAQWQHYRQPPLRLLTRFLRFLCGYQTCWRVVLAIRRSLRI